MLGLELAVQGLMDGARMGIAGLGFALIFYAARELHFAYGVSIAAGGYVVFSAVSAGLPIGVAILIALTFGAVLGLATRYLFYRPLGDHYSVLLFSFGLAIVIENALHWLYGPADETLPRGALTEVITLVPGTYVQARVIDLMGLGALIIVALALRWMMSKTRTGLAMTAVMKDPDMAELIGVRPERMRLLAYGIGSALAALSGSVTIISSSVRPSVGFELLLFAFILTLLAQERLTMVAVWGPIVGVAFALSAWVFPAEYGQLTIFTILLIYLLAKSRVGQRWMA